MKNNWWKGLSIILILYALVVGLLTPLSPGIRVINNQKITSNKEISLTINGYNTHYQDAKNLKAWLYIDSTHFLPHNKIVVKNQVQADVTFDIPKKLLADSINEPLNLRFDNEIDGMALFINAFSLNHKIPTSTITWSSEMPPVPLNDNFTFPFRNILEETIKNLYYHVPLWFAMMLLFLISAIYSIRYLSGFDVTNDMYANAFTQVGTLFGILGLITGMIWAKHTWGAYWSFDVKQNMSAIAMLIYMAYFVLRSSFDDEEKQARIAAVYNIFAFATLIPLLFIIPRLADSLHPGNGGNPGLGSNDLDHTMRMVFYPAIIGFILLGTWMASLLIRIEILRYKLLDEDE